MSTTEKIVQIIKINSVLEFYKLIVLSIFVSLSDLLSVVSIFPFMSYLANFDNEQNNPFVSELISFFGVSNTGAILGLLIALAFFCIVGANSLKISLLIYQQKYLARVNVNITKLMTSIYIDRPYSWHLQNDSSEISKNILTEVDHAVGSGLSSYISLISALISVAVLLGFLVFVDPTVAIIMCLTLGSIYGVVGFYARRYIKKASEKRFIANGKRFQFLNEMLGGIVSIKIAHNSEWHLKKFLSVASEFVRLQANATIVKQIPRHMLELVAIVLLLSFIGKMAIDGKDLGEILPLISTFAFAGYKLVPYFQSIYGANIAIQFARAGVESLYANLKRREETSNKRLSLSTTTIDFKNTIAFVDLKYSFGPNSKPILDGINVKISKGDRLVIIGPTGCGKSTLINCLTGLLEPRHGFLKVDGINITACNRVNWQKQIGFTQQSTVLINNTLKQNIILDDLGTDTDNTFLEKIIDICELSDLVAGGVEKVLNLEVGERGKKLSGGQIQRVGIARALYRKPNVLIMDEPTSAIDRETERRLLKNILNTFPDMTMIVVSHSIEILQHFENVIAMRQGKIIYSGIVDEFLSEDYNGAFATGTPRS